MSTSTFLKLKLGLIFVVATLLTSKISFAQVPTTAAAYPFQAFNTPFSYLVGGSSAATIHNDDATLTGIALGFTFPFAGGTYTQVSACSNGWLSLANSGSNTFSASQANAGTLAPVLMPIFSDMWGANS